MLVNLARCMEYWDDLSWDAWGILRRQSSRVVSVDSKSKDCAKRVCVQAGLLASGEIGCLEKLPPLGHSNLKTCRTDYRKRCRKRSHAGLTLLNVIDFSTEGFLKIFSNVPVAQERSLSFTYGRPDESCGSFTQMYFGKRRVSHSDKFVSEPLNFTDDCVRYCPGQKGNHIRKLAGHIVHRFAIWWTDWVPISC